MLEIHKLSVQALESEDYLLFAGITDEGEELDQDQCRRLFDLPGEVKPRMDANERKLESRTGFQPVYDGEVVGREGTQGTQKKIRVDSCSSVVKKLKKEVLVEIPERNANFFDEEMEKLDKWADDVKKGLEIRLKQLDVEIKTLKAEARKMADLQRKVAAQRKIKEMEKKRSKLRRNLFDEQDQIDHRKDDLLGTIEAKMSQKTSEEKVMRVQWEII